MPLAFSTLGCPGDSLAQVIDTARAAGATGLEIRVADGEFAHPGMDAAERAAIAAALCAAGLELVTLASYVKVCAPLEKSDGALPTPGAADAAAGAPAGDGAAHGAHGAADPVLSDLLAAVELAADLSRGNAGAPAQVRVFPGAGIEPCKMGQAASAAHKAADRLGADRLNAAAARARELGVTMLLETHDSHPRASDIARLLQHVDADAPVKVIWDLMHPWRHDEAPERTAQLLADSLAYAQYKDGVRNPGGNTVTLTLPGDGELPLAQMRELVAGISEAHGVTDPWISLEWERAWHPQLPPVADALESLKAVLGLDA
ncbi:sugar phosphate isomerase/epimerase [Arthrobacter stackebrandtii]|uniref:Sugar phosphate isomerase/epimerase n=1 Tax=Arthrobacter stackebrandtii TaxID=272161 RepID=A0ABS4YSY8_9MICC|nr:TIM barrel protein [Arthrobacter stackebrandtii]MBP2411911.1 sugar phosphate isomerase/epimerase [Arthrobacter stackebrandtii]PYG99062.1 sugar phosphate isomerase/epimerase [Arthrobacter stackebrandtii]